MEVSKNSFEESYEQYLKNVKEIQDKEINSNRFIEVLKFNHKYNNRTNKEIEDELFNYIGNYNEVYYLNETNIDKKKRYTKTLKKVKKLINSLDSEEIESNIFLSSTDYFLKSSKEDCKKIINELMNEYNSTHTAINKKISIDIDISKETLNKIKNQIPLQVSIPFYNPSIYKYNYVNIVGDKDLKYYQVYNDIINIIRKICIDVYVCRLWKYIPDELIDNISLRSFDICNGIKEDNEFNIKFYINKDKVKKKK